MPVGTGWKKDLTMLEAMPMCMEPGAVVATGGIYGNRTMAREQKAKIEYRAANGEAIKATEKPADIVFKFANGQELAVNVKSLPKDIVQTAAIRGVAEKIRDTYAGAETVGQAHELAEDMIGRLVEGEWMSAREGGGPRMTMLLQAIKEVKEQNKLPFDLEESRAKYVGSDDDTDEEKKAKAEARKAAAANPQVAAVLERLKAEAAARRAEKQAPAEALDTQAL